MRGYYFALNHGQHGITSTESEEAYLKESKEEF
jgi:hypothetical protein